MMSNTIAIIMKRERLNSFFPDGFRLAFDLPEVPDGYRVEVRTDTTEWIGIIYLIGPTSHVER